MKAIVAMLAALIVTAFAAGREARAKQVWVGSTSDVTVSNASIVMNRNSLIYATGNPDELTFFLAASEKGRP